MKEDGPAYRLAVRPVLAAAALLTVPLVAMQLTDEVAWSLADFVVAGALVVGTGLVFELAARRTSDTAYRAAAGVALAAALLLVWLIGAVGVLGAAGDRADLMYAGVFAVGVAGTLLARFRPRGMARAMLAAALAQASVAGVALAAGMVPAYNTAYEILVLNGFFVALWLASAWLFGQAAGERTPAGAGAEGRPGAGAEG